MNRSFEGALVEGWGGRRGSLALPDPGDRHVVAAAIRGRADTIVTANLRDCPEDVLEPLGIGIAAIDPDSFLLDRAPRVVLEVLREQAALTSRPSLTPTDLIARLARAVCRHLPTTSTG